MIKTDLVRSSNRYNDYYSGTRLLIDKMADRVNRNVDRFVKDAEFLQNIGIYDEDETKKYIKDTVKLEYGVCKKISVLIDYLKYIKYHIAYYDETERRLKEKKVPNADGILLSHQRRIHFIFRRSLQKFKNCNKMWCLHFKFCIETNNLAILESSITNFIRLHFTSDTTWCLAAYWYSFHNADTSKKCLKKALQIIPESALLWESLIQLTIATSLKKDENLNEIFDSLSCALVKTNYNLPVFEKVYDNLCRFYPEQKLLNSLKVHISYENYPFNIFLHLLKKHLKFDEEASFKSIQDSLLFYKSESALICLCQILQDNSVKIKNTSDLIFVLNNIIKCYNVDNHISENAYSQIISVFIKLNDITNLKILFDNVMNEFKKSWLITKEYLKIFYIYFFESYEKCNSYFSKILTTFPTSNDIIIKEWLSYIYYYNDIANFELSLNIFIKKHLYYIGTFVFHGFDFMFLKYGYEYIKNIIAKYSSNTTITSDLILKMAHFELISSNEVVDHSLIVKLFEYQISEQGKDSTNFWIEYIKFEMKKLKLSNSWENDSILSIYNRAIKTLAKNRIQDFISKFTVLQTTST